MDPRYINQIEVIVSLFTLNKGKLNVLLFRKDNDPFKGYWMLPSNLLMTSETIFECASDTLKEMAGITNLTFKQCNIFSDIDRLPNDRILANSLIAIIDNQTLKGVKYNKYYECAWFPIDEIPKMVYDHGMILEGTIKFLQKDLLNVETLRKLFPSDFTMPELQNVFEHILDKKLDRRNFSKKILNLNILEATGDKNNTKNGRPARLYRFISDRENMVLF